VFADCCHPADGSSDLQSLFCQPIKLKNWATTETPKDAKVGRCKENSSLDTVRTPGVILSSDQTENTQEIMETPQAAALAGLKVTAGNSNVVSVEMGASSTTSGTAHQTENAAETPVKPSVIAPETPVRTSEQTAIAPETPVVSEHVEIAPETPVRESMSKRFFKDPGTCYKKSRPASPFTSFEEHPSVYYVENRDLDTILMNDEVLLCCILLIVVKKVFTVLLAYLLITRLSIYFFVFLLQQVNADERQDLQQGKTHSEFS